MAHAPYAMRCCQTVGNMWYAELGEEFSGWGQYLNIEAEECDYPIETHHLSHNYQRDHSCWENLALKVVCN